MLCSKLFVAHVPHPNNLVYFNQRVIVNTLFMAGVCLFLYSIDSATDSSGGAWLAHANSAHQHSTIELCYLMCQLKSLFNVSNSVI